MKLSFRPLLLFLSLFTLFSGCLQAVDTGQQPLIEYCSKVTPAVAHAGDSYSFDAYGDFWAGTESVPIRWATQEQNAWFRDGATMSVKIGPKIQDRVSFLGEVRAAYQATYWAIDPAEPQPLPFLDHWVDAENGGILQRTARDSGMPTDLPAHITVFDFWGQPPLLLAPVFWDRELAWNDSISWSFLPSRVPGKFLIPESSLEKGEINYRIGPIWYDSESLLGPVCLTKIDINVRSVLLACNCVDRTQIEMVMADGFPFPLYYNATRRSEESPESRGFPFNLRLREFHQTNGTQLPPFDPAKFNVTGESTLERRSPVDGFLASKNPVFPTAFSEALKAARDDRTTGAWLEAHPDAYLTQVWHHLGSPDSDVIDRWVLQWAVPTPPGEKGPGFTANVWKQRLVPPVLSEWLFVEGKELYDKFKPAVSGSWMTLDALADVHQRYYGTHLEWLRCDLTGDYCHAGTHNNTGEPYAGSGFVGNLLAGLRVWLSEGRLLVDVSASMYAAGPPVE